jgi:hypothetical protein
MEIIRRSHIYKSDTQAAFGGDLRLEPRITPIFKLERITRAKRRHVKATSLTSILLPQHLVQPLSSLNTSSSLSFTLFPLYLTILR